MEKATSTEARVQFMQAAIETHKRTVENERSDHVRKVQDLTRDLTVRS